MHFLLAYADKSLKTNSSFFCVQSHCGRWKFKVVLVSCPPPTHSAWGGLHHRLVTGMTESWSHAGGRTGGCVIDSPAGAQRQRWDGASAGWASQSDTRTISRTARRRSPDPEIWIQLLLRPHLLHHPPAPHPSTNDVSPLLSHASKGTI